MYKLATDLFLNRYYKLSQDSMLPAMKLVVIDTKYCIFDCMGTARKYPTKDLHNRIQSERIWILRDKYRELIVKFASLVDIEIAENFDDSAIPQHLKDMAIFSIDLLDNWYSK